MGNITFFRTDEHELGDVAKGRWTEMRRLLPLFVEYVNGAMLLHDSTPLHVRAAAPPNRPFQLSHLVRDQSQALDEIYFEDANELLRLFAWFDFLVARDGAAELYATLVEQLRSCTRGIEAFASSLRPELPYASPSTET